MDPFDLFVPFAERTGGAVRCVGDKSVRRTKRKTTTPARMELGLCATEWRARLCACYTTREAMFHSVVAGAEWVLATRVNTRQPGAQ